MQEKEKAKVDFLIYFFIFLNCIWLNKPVIIELMDNFCVFKFKKKKKKNLKE